MVRFTPALWNKVLRSYVRDAATAHLFTGEGLDPGTLREIVGGEYRPHVLIGARWEYETRGDGLLIAKYPELEWRFAPPLADGVTGWFVRDSEGAVLLWEAVPGDPFEVKRKGDTYAVEIFVDLEM